MRGPRPAAHPLGRLLRHLRKAHGISQEDLAARAGLSARHLSFVETGRTQPSREAVIALASAVGVHDVGTFLEAAGYIAPYPDLDLAAPAMQSFGRELTDVTEAQHDPAVVHDRFGTILRKNGVFDALIRCFADAEACDEEPLRGYRLLAALRSSIVNWEEISALYRRRVFGELMRGAVELGDDLLDEYNRTLGAPDAPRGAPPSLFTPLRMKLGERAIVLRCLTSTLGTPPEIPLRSFRLLILVPGDAATHAFLDGLRR